MDLLCDNFVWIKADFMIFEENLGPLSLRYSHSFISYGVVCQDNKIKNY